jgi:hypothetical protein
MELFARFPGWRFRGEHYPVLPPDAVGKYPELAADIEVLEKYVSPDFRERDLEALREQFKYRRLQVALLLVSALLTGLGGLQAIWPQQRWPGVLLAVLGLAAGFFSQSAKDLDPLSRFLAARVQAERLRGLYFRYLARLGPYSGADREKVLREAVALIGEGKEPPP